MKKLGFGCMRLPVLNNNQAEVDIDTFEKMIDIFLEKGFTYFDTAVIYHEGKGEAALKEALVKRYPRDAYTLTTKLFLHNLTCLEDAKKMFNNSLNELGVDFVDYYWLHAVRLYLYEKVKDFGIIEYLKEQKKQGKIKHLGFSYHDSAEHLDQILADAGDWVEYVQLQLNYYDWDSETVEARKCYEVCEKYNKKVIVMEPVKGGRLVNIPSKAEQLFRELDSGASNASWAIRFAASKPNVEVVLSGMSTISQVLDNTSYMEDFKPLNKDEEDTINQVLRIIKENKLIECTGCRYCLEACPQGIPIPDIFAIYNNINHRHDDYKNATLDKAKASECLKCGACEGVCPQSLTIRDYLDKCVETLEKEV